jgi:hypothetical protein
MYYNNSFHDILRHWPFVACETLQFSAPVHSRLVPFAFFVVLHAKIWVSVEGFVPAEVSFQKFLNKLSFPAILASVVW